MTIEEIRTRINQSKNITRQDVLDVLNSYADLLYEKDNLTDFFKILDSGIVSEEIQRKILDDLSSYKVNYERC